MRCLTPGQIQCKHKMNINCTFCNYYGRWSEQGEPREPTPPPHPHPIPVDSVPSGEKCRPLCLGPVPHRAVTMSDETLLDSEKLAGPQVNWEAWGEPDLWGAVTHGRKAGLQEHAGQRGSFGCPCPSTLQAMLPTPPVCHCLWLRTPGSAAPQSDELLRLLCLPG